MGNNDPSAHAVRDKVVIAYLVRPAEGGIKSHLLTLLSGLDRSRFEPVMICPPDTALFREVEAAGCKLIPLDLSGDLDPVSDLRAILRLRNILKELKPDILHIHSAKAGLVGRLAAATLPGRPRILLTMHSFVFDERTGKKKRALAALIERSLLGMTEKIITVSKALKDQIVKDMGIEPRKIEVIYNGVDFQTAPQSAGKTESSSPVIGTVSRLAPQKGVDHFLHAAALIRARHPSARFVVIGDGPFRGELEALASKLRLSDCVEFLGFRSDATEIVAGFDLFILASTWETFGLTLVEALSVGVPVVASRVGGIPEIIDGKTTGLLADPGDAEGIASQACRLLENAALADKMGSEGMRFVRSTFTSERMVSELEKLYLSPTATDRLA